MKIRESCYNFLMRQLSRPIMSIRSDEEDTESLYLYYDKMKNEYRVFDHLLFSSLTKTLIYVKTITL